MTKRPRFKLSGIINEAKTERDFNHTLELTPYGIGETIRMIIDHNKAATSFVFTVSLYGVHRSNTKM